VLSFVDRSSTGVDPVLEPPRDPPARW